MKGNLALIAVMVGLVAGPVLTNAAAPSGGGGSGGGAGHAGGGSSAGSAGHAGGGADHAGPGVGSAAHAAGSHAIAAAHVATAREATAVKAAKLAQMNAAKPKVPPKTFPWRHRGQRSESWQIASIYCFDRDYSLGGLADHCKRSSKSSDKGG